MGIRKRTPDQFADHFLGGVLPPHLRKHSLGHRGRRRAALLLGTMALMILLSVLASAASAPKWQVLLSAGFALLIGAGAVRMYPTQRRTPRRD